MRVLSSVLRLATLTVAIGCAIAAFATLFSRPVKAPADAGPQRWWQRPAARRAGYWLSLFLLLCACAVLEWSRLHRWESALPDHAGGVLGGISTGQDLRVAIAIKPTSSIRIQRDSIDRAGQPTRVETFGRHDPCVGIRATPIAEAMMAIVLMDHLLRHRGQNADVRVSTPVLGQL